jgi:selenocysteine lyase/cysteine desulfurase
MFESQRRHFLLPRDVAYLDAAAITPMAAPVRQAAESALAVADRPWAPRAVDKAGLLLCLRAQAAALIGARPEDIAVVSAVSYAMASAAANLPLQRGTRVLLLADDHPSACLVWERRARACGATVDRVPAPLDGDWTAAVLERLAQPGAAPVGVAVLPPLHWTDGTTLDLPVVAAAVRAQGAALVVDATQAAGIVDLDVDEIRPDFLAFPAYKWLLGPYGLAFVYAAPQHQQGEPLEQHMNNRVQPALRLAGTPGDYSFIPGAQRFDRGERDNLQTLAMASAALELLGGWTPGALRAHLRGLTDQVADGVAGLPLDVAPRPFRAPHIIGLRPPAAAFESTVAGLAHMNVFVSPRRGVIRVAPHAYNDAEDVARLLAGLRELLG